MHNQLFNNHLLENLANNKTLIISSNHRLKLSLLSRFDQVRCEPVNGIYALDEWIQLCWQQLPVTERPYGGVGTLLSATQELFFWNSLVENDDTAFLVTPHATSVKAFEAVRLLGLYPSGSGELQKSSNNTDHELFLDWLARYRKACIQRKFITHIDQVQALISAYEKQRLSLVPHIILLGFIRIPPLYRRLLEAASQSMGQPDFQILSTLPHQAACQSSNDEIETAGRWVKQKLAENPNQKLCILVPDINQRRTQVNRILKSILCPELLIPGNQQTNSVFNISAAPTLAQAPLIFAARKVLNLNRHLFALETGISLLSLPFFLNNERCAEPIIQAQAILANECKPMVSLADVKAALRKSSGEIAKQYLRALNHFSQLLDQASSSILRLSDWATLFSKQLLALSWPGQRTLSSTEFQQRDRWNNALAELATLDPLYGPVHLEKALELLDILLENIAFQAKSADCPVQVLGTLECLGLPLDALWITGFNDDQWPAPVNPNPFLPVFLQRKRQMPHSDPCAELEYAKLLMTNYQKQTPELIVSYSRREDDKPLRPSSLINGLAIFDSSELRSQKTVSLWGAPNRGDPSIHWLPDSMAPALKATEEPLPGGAAMVKNQSLCPFKAFAIHRLNAREKRLPEWHISESQRGQMLHRSMQLLWEQLKNHQTLVTASAAQITSAIDYAVDLAMKDLIQQRPDLTTELFIDAEKNRLHLQLDRWLELEARRQPFRVLATEQEKIIQVEGDQFRVRIDRLDELVETGELILIDYKTGDCSLAGWQGERPGDPQLPLYCMGFNLSDNSATAPGVVALTFAKINAREQRFLGVSSQPDLAPGIETPDKIGGWHMPTTWQQIENLWRESIATLLKEFKDGVAKVNPAIGACRYCHLQPLCRINDERIRVKSS